MGPGVRRAGGTNVEVKMLEAAKMATMTRQVGTTLLFAIAAL